MPKRRVLPLSANDKRQFIEEHIDIFRDAFKLFAYPSLDDKGKRVYDLIIENFKYSPRTAKCDVVHVWYEIYNRFLLRYHEKPETMAKTFDDKKIKQRIKDVFADKVHSEAHVTLKRIFPELYQEYIDQDWNRTHRVGHLYVRIEGSSGAVKSLLIPTAMSHEDSHNVTIRFFNIIAGNFWSKSIVKNTVQTNGSWRDLDDEEWTELTRGWEADLFIHIGQMDHGNNNVILRGKNDQKKVIYEKY